MPRALLAEPGMLALTNGFTGEALLIVALSCRAVGEPQLTEGAVPSGPGVRRTGMVRGVRGVNGVLGCERCAVAGGVAGPASLIVV